MRSDVSEMVRTRQQLEALNVRLEGLSTTDALTGVSNRRLFDERLGEEIRRGQRHGQPLALLFIDVDHFKRYNDRYGHPAGDAVLRRVAALLRQQARRPGDLAARYGGEEFALLLPHTDETAALSVAERCLAALANAAIAHADSPTAPHLTLSVGVAAHRAGAPDNCTDPARLEDAAALIARADAALYEAKQRGRACAVVAPRAVAG
jgi:diguanylate cyclase (GGDEF)-like protein